MSVAKEVAQAAGRVLLEWRDRFAVSKKGPRDLVTQADLASQEAIQRRLVAEFPLDGFVGEEEGAAERPNAEVCWYVDPLDGTTNYVHGIPFYCVSIAAAVQGEPTLGVIHDPVAKTTYWAAAGQGLFATKHPFEPAASNRSAKRSWRRACR